MHDSVTYDPDKCLSMSDIQEYVYTLADVAQECHGLKKRVK